MIAVQTFAADNEDVLPQPNWDGGADGSPKGWLYEVDSSATGTNRFKVNTGSLWRALQVPKIYFCPMDTKPNGTRYSAGEGTDMERPQQISSYAMNGAVVGYSKLRISHAGEAGGDEVNGLRVLGDGRDGPALFQRRRQLSREGVSARHNQGAIQAGFDTSVSYVLLNDWYNDVDDPNKNRLWCYPNSPDGRRPVAGKIV